MATTEPTINDAIANALRELRRVWQKPRVVSSENTGAFHAATRPDILIMEPGTSPVVLETEVLPAQTVEKEARSRLGKPLRANGKIVFASVAIRLPTKLRALEGEALSEAIRVGIPLEFACFVGKGPDECSRWPSNGWIIGDVADICLVSQTMTIPPTVVDEAADRLVKGVSEAAGRLDELASEFDAALKNIASTLKQEDGSQTRRMAMTIVANAFVFHASLAGQGGELATVRSIQQIRGASGKLSSAAVLQEWRKILQINYWPIFDIARQIVELLPGKGVTAILSGLADTAELILDSGLSQSHDLVGAIFQNVIVDRKFLAAFYTRPASAALLTELALSRNCTPRGQSWAEPQDILSLRFADFACGTGTLLSTVYQFTRHCHELAGGDEEKLHPIMMSDVLLGCDIMPAAAHITASMLSGAHPSIKYSNSSIMTMPYGKQPDNSVALGGLDLLQSQGTFSLLTTHASAITSKGVKSQDTWRTIDDKEFDLVIMNPPFTRPTNHEGNKAGVPNPMFAAFASSDEEQKAMSKHLQKITEGTVYHGNAGEGSAFLALADKKLRQNGRLAIVLPLSLQAGGGWDRSRTLLRQNYQDLCIVNIAADRDDDASFSADTGMGECLIIGTRTGLPSERATFVILDRAPSTPLEGAMMARVVRQIRQSQTVRKLEDGPIGGTTIKIGDDVVGRIVDAPLPPAGHWPISRVSDISVAQATYQLVTRNRLWLPSMSEESAIPIPMCRLSTLAAVGPLHRDINGTEYSALTPRGPFDIVPLTGKQEPTYPALWNHEADLERAILTVPDTEAIIRTHKSQSVSDAIRLRAATIWSTASRCHFNYDFRFNSQSTAAVYTERPSIGGRAWPSLNFNNPTHEKLFLLWANSTLGLLCHWWFANKQQSGRGSITLTGIPNLVTLDFDALSENQLHKGESIFEEFKTHKMRPFNEIDVDSARHLLDCTLFVDVLGLSKKLVEDGGTIDLLRRKLAREPSIRGGKKIKAN